MHTNTQGIVQSKKIYRDIVYFYNLNRKGITDSGLLSVLYYDSLGNLLANSFTTAEGEDELIKYGYSYDSNGLLSKETDTLPNNYITNYEYDYDSNGNKLNTYEYNRDTSILTIYHLEYNKKHQVSRMLTKRQAGNFHVSKSFDYGPDNTLVKEGNYDEKGTLLYSWVYEQDTASQKKTVYVELNNRKRVDSEYLFNKEQQCIRINKKSQFTEFTSSENLTINQSINDWIEISYNRDNTLFETDYYRYGKKIAMQRHYYWFFR